MDANPLRIDPSPADGHTQQPQPLIEMRDLVKMYQMGDTLVPALRGISLDVQTNEFLAIMGPSGSGKSTLMNLIGCLDRPSSGAYKLAGHAVALLGRTALARMRNRYIGFVFQSFNLLPRATALSNVALPLIYSGIRRDEREERAYRLLQLVGLGAYFRHRPAQMSGGQQQRVAIARALITQPALLLADEPTGNLDSRTGAEIMQIFQELHQQGLTIILITHDAKVAAAAQRRIELYDGWIVQSEPEQVLPQVPDELQQLDKKSIKEEC